MQYSYFNTNHFSRDEAFLAQKLALFSEQAKTDSPPFANLDFVDSLIQSLDTLTPYLQTFKHMILLGVGGSALGPKALQEAYAPQGAHTLTHANTKHLWIIDNTNSPLLQDCLTNLSPKETVVLVISKSGSTLSTIAQYHICKAWLQTAFLQNAFSQENDNTIQNHSENLNEKWQDHIFAITDETSGFLREEVKKYEYKSLPVPHKMSGRFSLFSAVGMVSSAFLGINYKDFLKGAQSARDMFFSETNNFLSYFQSKQNSKENTKNQENTCNTEESLRENLNKNSINEPQKYMLPTLYKLAYFAYESMEAEFSQLIFFNYIPQWERLGDWFRQLWSESLGKEGHGSTPIPALGATDQHSILQLFLDGKKDKVCIFLAQASQNETEKGKNDIKNDLIVPQGISPTWDWIAGKSLYQIHNAEANATRTTLINSAMPLVDLQVEQPDEFTFGKITWNLCMLTILTGYFLELNPFDQPAVEEGKKLTKETLSK